MSKKQRLFLVAGEVSGDTHGAALMRALPEAEFDLGGLGGPQMAKLAAHVEDWLDEAAVLGLWEVLKKYGYFRAKMEETVSRIGKEEPDAVVLIDYPGFNLRLAKRLRKEGFAGKLIYYISPQVWAWKKGRIKVMAELLDLMICIFPFEKPLYENSGLDTVFAGHPLVDSLAKLKRDDLEREPDLIALLPGSREREVEALFPAMAEAAVRLKQRHPELRFAASAVSDRLADRMHGIANEVRLHPSCLEIGVGNVHDVMQRAAVGVVASGTATLEAAYFGLPYCLVYKVAWLTYVVGRAVVDIDYLGIVNVIADREVVKELLQGEASGERISRELERLLSDEGARESLQHELAAVIERLGGGGAHENAANAIREVLEIKD